MASIAYITDKKMIEYHRLNAHTSINFWRPGNLKKFADFHIGDFLFFLAKGTEHGVNKEKGIIGYGRLERIGSMSFDQMWKKYKTSNGYHTKIELKDAILKVTKDHVMPEKLTCLELEQVIFFQSPVYLSELDKNISNKIESYIYLDKDNDQLTNQILSLANKIGLDMWSSIFYEEPKDLQITQDKDITTISFIYNKIKKNFNTKYDDIKTMKLRNAYIEQNQHCVILPDSMNDFISYVEGHAVVCIPCIINTKDCSEKLQYIIGHYMLYHKYMEMMNIKPHIKIIFNDNVDEETAEMLRQLNIKYETALTIR